MHVAQHLCVSYYHFRTKANTLKYRENQKSLNAFEKLYIGSLRDYRNDIAMSNTKKLAFLPVFAPPRPSIPKHAPLSASP
jgi:hypothetical protein